MKYAIGNCANYPTEGGQFVTRQIARTDFDPSEEMTVKYDYVRNAWRFRLKRERDLAIERLTQRGFHGVR